MYTPPAFEPPDLDAMHALIDAHALGAFVTATADGLFVSHIPFVLDRTSGAFGTLRGHVARGNPHHRLVASLAQSLVMFLGPQAYVSPAHYPSKAEHGRVVPTWNYAVVHAHGEARFDDSPQFLLRNVAELTRRHEADQGQSWSIEDAPAGYIEGLTRGIVGVELVISRLEGKWKLSQNREARDAEGVARGLAQGALEAEREVSRMVAERLAAQERGE